MKVIKDVNGGTLHLTKTRLKEVTHTVRRYERWTMKLRDLKEEAASCIAGYVALYLPKTADHGARTGSVNFSLKTYTIGCRSFSKSTFNEILKAACIKRKRK